MDGWNLLLLAAQGACAVVGYLLLRRRVCPALAGADEARPSIVADVWTPLALLGPMLLVVARVGSEVQGIGWVPLGGPVCAGVVGAGLAVRALASPAAAGAGPGRLPLACAGTGVVVLLLGGAHDLTIWTGQCTFALAAVLLWQNTPSHGRTGHAGTAGTRGAGAAAAGMIACAAGQGACSLLATGAAVAVSAAVMVTAAALGAMAVAGRAGPGWGARVGGWTAVLGVLLAIGVLSLAHLAPLSYRIVTGEPTPVTPYVARGFGAYAPEGVLLLLLAASLWGAPRLAPGARGLLGSTLLVIGAALAVWRLLALP